MEVNKDRVQLLVDELRSDRQKQGREYLEYIMEGDTYRCCLGVACRVAMANGLEVAATVWEHPDLALHYTKFDGERDYLPFEVVEWFGFPNYNPFLLVADNEASSSRASTCNDERGMTFEEIADAFERTFLRPAVPDGE